MKILLHPAAIMMLKTLCVVYCFIFVASGNDVQPPNDKNRYEEILEDVIQHLMSLESKYQLQANENANLQKSVENLQAKVSMLEKNNKQLKNEIRNLRSRDQNHDEHIKDLQKQVSYFVSRDEEFGEEANDFIGKINTSERHDDTKRSKDNDNNGLFISSNGIPEKIADRSIRRRENEMNVAFFSTLGNHLQHLGVNQNIVFDHVVTNIGNAYNNHAGDFRAPVAGTYVFSVTLMAYGSHTTHYRLVKGGSSMANIYVRGTESPYASSSMTAVLQLKQGDDVAIRNVDNDEFLHGSSYSAFSGFLLYQDFSSSVVVGK